MTSTRVKGHTLCYEGAPHDDNGWRINDGLRLGISGTGRARCSCGEMSPVLPSAYQRKRWHRTHKSLVAEEVAP